VSIEVPEIVRNKATVNGVGWWVDALPSLVAELCDEWSVTVDGAWDEGTEAVVLSVVGADGTPAALKLGVPHDASHIGQEIAVLRLADGEGCARLLRADEARGALLLERLGPSMFTLGVPYEQRVPLLCDAAAALWRPAPDAGFMTGAEKGAWLMTEIERRWELLDRPCARRTVEHALVCAARRVAAHDDERAVLVHGDVHRWNALQTLDGSSFKLVDPDGLLAEAEYDLGIIMREDPTEGDLHERARFLATRTGLDVDAIWDWGVVERLSTALLAIEIDLQPEGDQLLALAERLATPA
jgi:streptomycin 6-kinase